MHASDNEEMAEWKVLHADADAQGSRLDQWLAATLAPELSRNRIQALVRGGSVTLNDRVVTEPKQKVAEGDVCCINMPEPEAPEPMGEDIPLDVLYEDDSLIVINKPVGLVVHPGPGNWTGTLVNALIHHCGASLSGIGGVRRPGIVHRIDRDTSGVLVVAKTDQAHRSLAEAFADHGRNGDLERAYVALVWGAPSRVTGVIETWLGRSNQDRTMRAVVPQGRPDARHAITHYTLLERYGDANSPIASLVECRLETGRTHQIRVHMAHIGHPLIGDQAYGRSFRTKVNKLPEELRTAVESFERQALHARLLAFRHPVTGEMMRFEAPLPEDMATLQHLFSAL
ncbi:RluA family pseudouridine synthase [Nitratireductor aestuarii]